MRRTGRGRRSGWLAVVGAVVVLASGTALGAGSALADPPTDPPADPPTSVPVAEVSGPIVEGTPCTASARACVDVAGRRTWLITNGKVTTGPVPIRPGDADDPTPLGTFAVQWKAVEWTSRQYLTQMPYSVFFAPGGIAFHQGSMDTPSGGCVKLNPADARYWFDVLQVGDQVQVR